MPTGKSALELRAMWVQCEAAKTPEQADEVLDRVARGNFNTVLYCVGSGIVSYNSSLLTKASYVTPDYDPLAYVVEQAHAKGLNVQAWWCPGWIMSYGSLRDEHPEWDIAAVEGIPDDLHWANFSLPEVRQFVGDVVMEIVENYDVDGVHLDYIRYGGNGFEPAEYEGFSPYDVSFTVQNVYQRVKSANPDIAVTAAVFAWLPGAHRVLQYWDEWLKGEYIDYVMPMAYYDPTPEQNEWLRNDVEDWRTLPHPERIAAGLKIYTSDRVPKTPEQLMTQVELCRTGGFEGVAIFDENSVTEEQLTALAEYFQSGGMP